MSPRRPPSVLAVALLLAPGCEGAGEGQVAGSLYLRGCPHQADASAAAPPPFRLDPDFLGADTVRSAAMGPGANAPDPRIPHTLTIRLQRSSHRSELTDGFSLQVVDVMALRERLGAPFPITAPPLVGPGVPLPAMAPPLVRAAVWLRGSCPIAYVQPLLRGTVTFSELGFEPGEIVAGEFAVSVDDARGERLGLPPAEREAAGALAGSFRFPIRRGRSLTFP